MKNKFAFIALIALQTLTAHAIPSFCGGSGTSSDPYKICTAQDLADLGDFVNAGETYSLQTAGKYFILMNDIDLTTYLNAHDDGGKGWKPIGTQDNYALRGDFNGGRHKITGLWINRPDNEGVGLFGFFSGKIYNLGVEIKGAGSNVSGSSFVGGLVGANAGTIRNSVAAISSIEVTTTTSTNNFCRFACDADFPSHPSILSNNYANSAMGLIRNGDPSTTFTDSDVNGTGKPLATLKTFDFYNTPANWHTAAWDIDNVANPAKIWQINDGTSFPFFQSQTNATVPKVAGATVAAPALASKTTNSITIIAVIAPANGQVVEYGINTSNTAPNTWQTDLTFTSLSANTTYYIFARSKENTDYNAGSPSTSLQVKTNSNSSGGVTPINPSQTTISNIHVKATSNAIVLSNLPPNTKVDVYNLQGKRIYFSNSGNSQILRILVQTKGIYIVKAGTQTMRAVVR